MSEPSSPPLAAIPDPRQLRPLHPAVRKVWLFGAGTSAAFLLALLVPGSVALRGKVPFDPLWPALALAVWPLLKAVLFVDRQFRSWGYLLTDRELVTRHGVWWRAATYIPRESIQHVDINQGPVDRWNGLAQIVVHTAGAGAVATIPGLALKDAQELRDRLMPEPGRAE